MKDLDILITKNGRYIMIENMIYDKVLDRHGDINNASFSDLIDIIGENVSFLAQDIKADLKEISSFTRKNVYHVFECFTETDKRLSLMMEYEVKFGGSLLTESVTNPKAIVAETWSWIKEQVIILEQTYNPFKKDFWSKSNAGQIGKNIVSGAKSAAKSVVDTSKSIGKAVGNAVLHPIDTIKKGYNWVKENGLGGVMSKIRDMLYSGVGTAIQIFLQLTGVGNVAVAIVWGVFLIYDLYQGFVNGKWEFLYIIFDIMGIVFAGGIKILKAALTGVNVAGKSMAGTVQTLAANPATKGVMSKIASGFSTVIGWLKQAASWLSQKLGLTKFAKWVGQGEVWLSENILKPIGNTLGLKNIGNKTLGGMTVGQASRQATIATAKQKMILNPGIEKGAEKGIDLYYANKLKGLPAQAPVPAPVTAASPVKPVIPNNYGLDDDISSYINNLATT